MSTKINRQSGFTLLETLIYAAGLVVLLGAIFGLLAYTYTWYRTATIGSHVDAIGMGVADHIVKSIRSGQSSNTSSSLFGTTTGALSITSYVNSTTLTKQYNLVGGRITYKEGSGSTQYLTPSDVYVSRLYFTDITNPISEGVRFDLDISYWNKTSTSTRTYSSVGVMQNSY
jgi:Tfp pilus assembly protein PilV